MNIKIADFAKQYGISDRHARRLLTDNLEKMAGHYERNNRGTWIDPEGAEILAGMLRNPIGILPEEWEPDVKDLQKEIDRLREENLKLTTNWAEAERRAGRNAAAAGQVALLEAAKVDQDVKIDALTQENGNLKAENAVLSHDIVEKDKTLEEERKNAQNVKFELSEALESERVYAAALEEWAKLPWFKRIRTPKPTRTEKE